MEEEGSAACADQAAHKLLLLAFSREIGHKQGVVARRPCARSVLPVLLALGEGRAPPHASFRVVFGTRRTKKKQIQGNASYFVIFRSLAHICGQRLLVQKETIRLYGHLLEDIGMCSAAGATRWVTVHV